MVGLEVEEEGDILVVLVLFLAMLGIALAILLRCLKFLLFRPLHLLEVIVAEVRCVLLFS